MRFLSDHDVFGTTVRFLRAEGHDVVTASELGMSQTEDFVLLSAAQSQQRILLTRDRDFGNLIFVANSGAGVVYLRMLPQNQDLVHAELLNVLGHYPESQILSSFIVVEPGRHRIRGLP